LSVDIKGEEVIVGGWSESDNMIVTTGGVFQGAVDMIVARLNDHGGTKHSMYWGDKYNDYCTAVAFDQDHNIYIAGYAFSDDFYSNLSSNPAQPDYGGGIYDGVVMKWDSEFTNLEWATPIGG